MAHLLAAVSLWPVTFYLVSRKSSRLTIETKAVRAVSLEEIPPNAVRRKRDSTWRGCFSLGVDLGVARTGLDLSLELRGQKLELRIIYIAQKQETPQSNKVRSVTGRLDVRATERGGRVYLQEEYGTTIDAMSYMVDR
ncbi:hypothetical protein KY289_025623 [Solanum tuberosum]|nr:hypothetical protein KY289_025623 [Solanum tuberosum]